MFVHVRMPNTENCSGSMKERNSFHWHSPCMQSTVSIVFTCELKSVNSSILGSTTTTWNSLSVYRPPAHPSSVRFSFFFAVRREWMRFSLSSSPRGFINVNCCEKGKYFATKTRKIAKTYYLCTTSILCDWFQMIFTPYCSYFTIAKHEKSYNHACASTVG